MNLPNFKTMTKAELKRYILENRNDDKKVRAAIAESSNRPGWIEVPADTPLEEQERILKELIDRKAN